MKIRFSALAALAVSGPALAGAPVQQAAEGPAHVSEEAEQAVQLKPRWKLTREGDVLLVELSVTNEGDQEVAALTHRGSRAAPIFSAVINNGPSQVAVEAAPPLPMEEREYMSRAGPRPRWAEVEQGASRVLCSFRMAWPGDSEMATGSLSVTAKVYTNDGEVELTGSGLRLDQPQG
jgi:hypothetical protein